MLRRRAAIFFLFMALPIVCHVIILSQLWDVAGRDAWISVLFAAPVGLIIAYLTWKLMGIKPDATLPEINCILWGTIGGTLVNSIWLIYFFIMAMITVMSLFDMFHSGFYPETPMWFIAFVFLLLVVYSLARGIKVIAWVAGLLTLTIMISGHTITVLLSPQREWRHLLPMLEHGWGPIMLGTVLLCAIWTEFFVITVVTYQKARSRGMLYILLVGAFANTIMMLSVAAGTISIFGFEHTNNMLYPVLSSVRMVTLGFIDRFDVYGLALMTFGCFIRCALFMHATIECLPKKITKYRTILIYILGTLLFITSLFLYQNKLQYEEMIRYYVVTLVLWVLPIANLIKNLITPADSRKNR